MDCNKEMILFTCLLLPLRLAKDVVPNCEHGIYFPGGQKSCCMCPAGTFLVEHCMHGKEEPSACASCQFEPEDHNKQYYTPVGNNRTHCLKAMNCENFMNTRRIAGSREKDASCECLDGFHQVDPNNPGCAPHNRCLPGFGVMVLGTASSDTKCSKCPAGTFSDIASATARCRPFSRCGPNYEMLWAGSSMSDVICGAKVNEDRTLQHVLILSLFLAVPVIAIMVYLCFMAKRGKRLRKQMNDTNSEVLQLRSRVTQLDGRREIIIRDYNERENKMKGYGTFEKVTIHCQVCRGSQTFNASLNDCSEEIVPELMSNAQDRSVLYNEIVPKKPVVSVQRKGDDIQVTWAPLSGFTSYCISVYRHNDSTRVYKDITCTNFLLDDVDPIKTYRFLVWGIDDSGKESGKAKTKDIAICTSVGNGIYYDDNRPLRHGYNVYSGFLVGAAGREEVAVKISGLTDTERINNEVQNLKRINHQNIISYRTSGYFGNGLSRIYMVTELCRAENLYDIVQNDHASLDSKVVLLQITHGLAYLHGQGIIHGDIKAHNVLLSMDGQNIKICDFDCSIRLGGDSSIVQSRPGSMGTRGWTSPEHSRGKIMTSKSDIFSAGLLFYFVLSGGNQVLDPEKYQTLEDPPGADNIADDLIAKMLHKVPANRPEAHDVLAHPFFLGQCKISGLYV